METNKNDNWYIRGRKGCAELIKQELLKRGADDPCFEELSYDVEDVLYYLQCGIAKATVADSLMGRRIVEQWEEINVEEPEPAPKFEPFDEVLVCDGKGFYWNINLYSRYNETSEAYPHICLAGGYRHCLPYKGNEHLLGVQFKPEHVKGVPYQN